MGVPKFYWFLSERYPCVNKPIKDYQISGFDNFYLDMNGIIHICCNSNDMTVTLTEQQIYSSIFQYVDFLFKLIKPKKLFFMAVDGVAPHAKINQQRARRFRTARDAELMRKQLLEEGKQVPETSFDSNCITPGTVFMEKLHAQLKYFVSSKISTDPHWQNCKVILSGHKTPGEGEHKIMDYIRYMKTLPDYDPNTRHCLYGSDADLILLGMATHEPHFCILREKVQFGKSSRKNLLPPETEFFLMHLSLLREYLDLEFQELKDKLTFKYDLENIIDDWVLMSFFVGNDFIPNLPNLHIHEGAIPVIYQTYKIVAPTLDGYINENGYLNLPRLQKYMESLGGYDLENYANLAVLEEKMGENSIGPAKKQDDDSPRRSELEDLIKATNDMFDDSSMDKDDAFLFEFSEHKKNYYANKFELKEVDEEVLRSQAEGYIRAIQWNLFYYYQGCQSWSWYYPHHYSPFISDITNFKDLKLEFQMDQPFLPFEQLLAVLPPASKELLPEVYRDLMESPDSCIIDYYPNTFETDLNGKRQDYEAVVLIPFIDEKKLLQAMEPCNAKLTEEDKKRNSFEPMSIYTYTERNLGVYEGNEHFPSVTENHALVEEVHPSQIKVDGSVLKRRPITNAMLDLYYPGFPTLRHIPFTASLKICKVRVFGYASRGESILLRVNPTECPPVEELVEILLGKIVYINWPYLAESKVVALSDGKKKYSLSKDDEIEEEELNTQSETQWIDTCRSVTNYYFDRLAVDIGSTSVIVYTSEFIGSQYKLDSKGKMNNEKIWSSVITPCAFQVMVKDIPVYLDKISTYNTLEDAFPLGSLVFMLGQPHFGCSGRVLDSSVCYRNGRLKVLLETVNDPVIPDSVLKSWKKNSYVPCKVAAQKLGMSPKLFSRLTGSIFINVADSAKPSERELISIGLNLKFSRKNEELPGYTKKKNDVWMYSTRAINLLAEYVEKFSRVVECLSVNCNDDLFLKREIFDSSDGVNGVTELEAIENWIKEQDYNQIKRIKCDDKVLDIEMIEDLEKIVDNFKKRSCMRNMLVKPHLLYKSDLVLGNVPPIEEANHQLLDRVVCVKSAFGVPVGYRGFIIGIHQAPVDLDVVYDILFDQPFPGGLKLYSTTERVYSLSKLSFLNISDANRRAVPDMARINQFGNTAPAVLNTEQKTSAFAQWNGQPAKPKIGNEDEQFKQMWSNLSNLQSQKIPEETNVLKKILKIEEPKNSVIEDSVKSFFDNVTKMSNNAIPKNLGNSSVNSNVAPTENFVQKNTPPVENKYMVQLLAHCQKNNIGRPTVKFLNFGNKIMAQIYFPDRRIYSGLPCDEKESACESAALQALGALGEVSLNNKALSKKDKLKEKKIKESQAKLASALMMDYDSEPIKNQPADKKPNKQKNRSPVRNKNKILYKNNNVAKFLPNPPPQWVGNNVAKHQSGSCNQSYESSQSRHKKEYRNKPQEVPKTNSQKLSASALDFVPLQAITGIRNRGTFPSTQLPSSVPVKPSNEVQKKTDISSIINQLGPSLATSLESKTVKRKRRPKIAANLELDPNLY